MWQVTGGMAGSPASAPREFAGAAAFQSHPTGESSMSKLLYSATMSLDGFIAGPDGDMSWLSEHLANSDIDVDQLMAGIGALLVGHRTFAGDDPNKGTDAEGAFG